MPEIRIPLVSDFSGLSINDFIQVTHHVADSGETNSAFQGDQAEYVTLPPAMRAFANELETLRNAVYAGNTSKKPELDALRGKVQRAHHLNAFHITAVSLHRNDPTIVERGGYALKEKARVKPAVNLLDMVPEVFVKHLSGVEGGIIVLVKRAKSKATIQLQWTDQDPNLEASWSGDLALYNKSRIELRGFTPASRIHVRARYHEDGASGRWSSHVTIIIL